MDRNGKTHRPHRKDAPSGRGFAPVFVGSLLLAASSISGCALLQTPPYEEKHALEHLHVVLMDDESLQAKWMELSGKPSVKFSPPQGNQMTTIKTVRGFFDYSTKTIYCPKLDFEICGHELFHAILGPFHPE